MEDTLQVVFRPARNGSGVICRLPNGKVAFPSRYHWKQAPPQPYEIWTVLPCGETASVAYVKPVARLAEAPFRDTRAGRLGNSLLWRLGRFLALLVRLPHASCPAAEVAHHTNTHAAGTRSAERSTHTAT